MKWLFLLRAFFPSWVFFVEASPEIRLEGRSSSHGDWLKLLVPIRRSFLNLFWNAKNNYLHSCHNSLQHLITDINELEKTDLASIEQLASYKVVKNISSFELLERGEKIENYQFRIKVYHPQFLNKEPEEVLVSPEYGVSK